MADDFNINMDGFDALENLLQGAHLEGQRLNKEAASSSKGAVSSPLSPEQKKERRKQQSQARKIAKKAGFDSVKAHQEHINKIQDMYAGGNANASAVEFQNQQTIKNINKPISMPIDGTDGQQTLESSDPNAPKIANSRLQDISNANREKYKNILYGPPSNLAVQKQGSTFLQAAAVAQRAGNQNNINGNNALANVTPLIARPFSNPLATANFNGTTYNQLPGGSVNPYGPNPYGENSSANSASEKAYKESQKEKTQKEARSGTREGEQNSKPWYEKMQDTLEDIRDDVAKLLEIAQRHTKTASDDNIKQNVSAAGDSNGPNGDLLSGIVKALGPMMFAVGAILTEKFGDFVPKIFSLISEKSSQAISNIQKILQEGRDTVVKKGAGVVQGVQDFVSHGGENITDAVHTASTFLANNVKDDVAKTEHFSQNKWAQAGSATADVYNKIRGGTSNLLKGVSGLFDNKNSGVDSVAKEFEKRIPSSLEKFALGAKSNTFGLVKGLSKAAMTGGAALVGFEAVNHFNNARKDLNIGNEAGAVAEGLRGGGDIVGAGGPKTFVQSLPFVGDKLASKMGSPLINFINKGVRSLVGRAKGAVAVDAASGGPLDLVGDAAAIGVAIGGEKGANYLADRAESKEGKKFFEKVKKSNFQKDMLSDSSELSKVGSKFGPIGTAVGGILGAVGGAEIGAAKDLGGLVSNKSADAVSGLLTKLSSIFEGNKNKMDLNSKAESHQQSVFHQAAAKDVSNKPNQASAGPTTINNSMVVNLPHAVIKSEDDAKRIIKTVVKQQQQQIAQQQKAKEHYSTPNQNNGIFGNIQNSVNALIQSL